MAVETSEKEHAGGCFSLSHKLAFVTLYERRCGSPLLVSRRIFPVPDTRTPQQVYDKRGKEWQVYMHEPAGERK